MIWVCLLTGVSLGIIGTLVTLLLMLRHYDSVHLEWMWGKE